MIGDKSSYKETPSIDSPTDRCPGIYWYLSGAVRLQVSRLTGQMGPGALRSTRLLKKIFNLKLSWVSFACRIEPEKGVADGADSKFVVSCRSDWVEHECSERASGERKR